MINEENQITKEHKLEKKLHHKNYIIVKKVDSNYSLPTEKVYKVIIGLKKDFGLSWRIDKPNSKF